MIAVPAKTRALERCLSRLGVPAALRRFQRRGLLILAYHGVAERRTADLPWTFISVDEFERQIAFLARHYRLLPLGEAVGAWRRGERLPGRSVAITFDDGYRNNLTLARPVLWRYGAPATVFVTAGYVGSDSLLPLDQLSLLLLGARGGSTPAIEAAGLGPLPLGTPLERLASFERAVARVKRIAPDRRRESLSRLERSVEVDPGWRREREEQLRILSPADLTALCAGGLVEVGAHTLAHHILATIHPAAAEREITESRSLLGRLIGRPVDLFAYPNGTSGDYRPEHVDMVARAGFAAAVTTIPGCNREGADLLQLSRVCVGPELAGDQDRFAVKLSRLGCRIWP